MLAIGVSPSGGIVRLWDAATDKQLRQLQSPNAWLGHVAFSPNGETVVAGADCHRIVLWETTTGRLLRQLDGREETIFAVLA